MLRMNRAGKRICGLIQAGTLMFAAAQLLSAQSTVGNFAFDNYRVSSFEQGCSIDSVTPQPRGNGTPITVSRGAPIHITGNCKNGATTNFTFSADITIGGPDTLAGLTYHSGEQLNYLYV